MMQFIENFKEHQYTDEELLCVCVVGHVDTMSLLISKFALASSLWKQARQNWNFNNSAEWSQFAVDYFFDIWPNVTKLQPFETKLC